MVRRRGNGGVRWCRWSRTAAWVSSAWGLLCLARGLSALCLTPCSFLHSSPSAVWRSEGALVMSGRVDGGGRLPSTAARWGRKRGGGRGSWNLSGTGPLHRGEEGRQSRMTAALSSSSSSSTPSKQKGGNDSSSPSPAWKRFMKKAQGLYIRMALAFLRATRLDKLEDMSPRKRRLASFVGTMTLLLSMRLAGRSPSRRRAPKPTEVPMSAFLEAVESNKKKAGGAQNGGIRDLKIASGGSFKYTLNGVPSITRPVTTSEYMLRTLVDNKVEFAAAAPSPPSPYVILLQFFPFVWLGALLYFMKRNMADTVGSVGKRADMNTIDQSLTFDDVMGIEGAKRDVQELVSMLKNPKRFADVGARLPSGLIMVGPPGSGKTLLARCMAAEAGVPYFYCSGSEFNEMFVGRGAARVRKLFATATKAAPSIIFFDELDTLGKQRSMSGVGAGRPSNDEAEQTLNQLLACMDGLDSNKNGVLVIAATNRYDMLDSALTRPGRFDRIVRVDAPDESGREAILKVHTRRMTLESADILPKVAMNTPGLTGAELAGIANEAAIRAVRRGDTVVRIEDFRLSVENFLTSRLRVTMPFVPPFLNRPQVARW